jgi:uncharacterized lipoprotein YehR (DUF1307 family)
MPQCTPTQHNNQGGKMHNIYMSEIPRQKKFEVSLGYKGDPVLKQTEKPKIKAYTE